MDKYALQRFFLNECSPIERKEVIAWLLNPQNDLLIKTWMQENWNLISHIDAEKKSVDLDVQKIWNDLSEKLFVQQFPANHAEEPVVVDAVYPDPSIYKSYAGPHKRSEKNILARLTKSHWITAAASVILALGLFVYGFRESIFYVRYQTNFNEVTEFTLADGSHVVLNANSSLIVPRWGFGKGNREVALTGEAAFNVIHTSSNQKFLVTTKGQFNVEVLGTEFSVYSRQLLSRVILKKGAVKVQFNKESHQPILMEPGDIVSTGNAGSLSLKHKQPINNIIPWKDHRFVFDNTSLHEVVENLSAFFGNNIEVSGDVLGKKTITGSFNATSAREMLVIVAELYDLEIVEADGHFILKEKTTIINEQ